MKRNVLFLQLIAVCLIAFQSCYVVYPWFCEEEYIPEICLTRSSVYGDDPSSSWDDPIIGFQAGIGLPVWSFSDQLSIRSGGLLSFQGGGWTEGNLEGRVNLWYANIPVELRYQLPGGFFAQAGLQPGLLLSAKDKYEGITENFMDYMNKFDLSVPVKIGYKFKNNIGVNLRMVPGLTDITSDKDEKDRNFVVGLGLTYGIKIKKKQKE
ncbi:MAG TPA: hypothetical protein DDW27_09190 [Bacteroidales bacterium]|nr:hypothetical protein [Bacteroidales bacterium]